MSAPNPERIEDLGKKSADRSPELALTAAKCLAGTNVQSQLAIKKLTIVLLLSKEIILQSTMRLTQRPVLGGGLEFGA